MTVCDIVNTSIDRLMEEFTHNHSFTNLVHSRSKLLRFSSCLTAVLMSILFSTSRTGFLNLVYMQFDVYRCQHTQIILQTLNFSFN